MAHNDPPFLWPHGPRRPRPLHPRPLRPGRPHPASLADRLLPDMLPRTREALGWSALIVAAALAAGLSGAAREQRERPPTPPRPHPAACQTAR
ncbi:hypothetical protein M0638_11180 [Roseomonas sp. NAR14]|uniref:Uncharacterized protein n=1 Tax=Roseomonas acroporae TaxID=2937791 RepID=A0A9X1Y6M5_9PROT|nr:hypothetical protein [Roseomonas acroporae]MCK8784944.1 hypothetical protein [Roseomonas acroporae]